MMVPSDSKDVSDTLPAPPPDVPVAEQTIPMDTLHLESLLLSLDEEE